MTIIGEEMLERVARALHGIEDSWNDVAWEYLPANTKRLFRKQARAAIDATGSPEAVTVMREALRALIEQASRVHQASMGEEDWGGLEAAIVDGDAALLKVTR